MTGQVALSTKSLWALITGMLNGWDKEVCGKAEKTTSPQSVFFPSQKRCIKPARGYLPKQPCASGKIGTRNDDCCMHPLSSYLMFQKTFGTMCCLRTLRSLLSDTIILDNVALNYCGGIALLGINHNWCDSTIGKHVLIHVPSIICKSIKYCVHIIRFMSFQLLNRQCCTT